MRVSAKVDYALRAMAQLAAEASVQPVTAVSIARAQDIPPRFLLRILRELKEAHLLRSHRGSDGGYALARPADQITVAEIMRVMDGSLLNLRDRQLRDLEYIGPARALEDVWMAVRASVRSVLETVTVADVVSGQLPAGVLALADEYVQSESDRPAVRFSSVVRRA